MNAGAAPRSSFAQNHIAILMTSRRTCKRGTGKLVEPAAKEALARGNVNFIRYELNELLHLFRINLDPACAAYRKVARAVIEAWVRALEDVRARNRGQPIDSPKLVEPGGKGPVSSCSLRTAYEGWDKMEQRPISTRMEFSRGIDRFIELHGDLDVAQINRWCNRPAQLVDS